LKILPHQLVALGAGAGAGTVAGVVVGFVAVVEDDFFIFDST
jgi:thiamine transporter ThiT